MAKPRDPAVTEYVRHRLRALIASKTMTGEQIAKKVGVSPAMISSIWTTGVGGRSIEGFARLFDFKGEDDLRVTAYEWYRERSPKTAARMAEPAVQAAVQAVQRIYPHLDEDYFRTLLVRFSDEAFAGREETYWIPTLLEEVKRDFDQIQLQKKVEWDRSKEKAAEEKGHTKKKEAFKTGHHLRKALKEQKAAEEQAAEEQRRADEEARKKEVATEAAPTETHLRPGSLRGGIRRKRA